MPDRTSSQMFKTRSLFQREAEASQGTWLEEILDR
jgi:hypothetical protein